MGFSMISAALSSQTQQMMVCPIYFKRRKVLSIFNTPSSGGRCYELVTTLSMFYLSYFSEKPW